MSLGVALGRSKVSPRAVDAAAVRPIVQCTARMSRSYSKMVQGAHSGGRQRGWGV